MHTVQNEPGRYTTFNFSSNDGMIVGEQASEILDQQSVPMNDDYREVYPGLDPSLLDSKIDSSMIGSENLDKENGPLGPR